MMPAPDSRLPDVTVIVVNYNGGEHVLRCLAAIAAQARLPAAVIVVDNASTDGSAPACTAAIAADPRLAERTRFVRLDTNVGFAAANNRGIAMADTQYVALLNPDAFPEPGWLASLLDAAARHPEIASFGSRQMLAGRDGIVDGLGDCYSLTGLAWRRGHGRRLAPADLVPREIFSPCAAAALYRRAAVLEVGGFDEDFFCYFEDVDLGLRLRLAGHRARSVPDAVVEHVGGASSGGGRSPTATYYGHRNLVWTAVKDLPAPLLCIFLLAQIPQTMFVAAVCAWHGRLRAFLHGKCDAVRGLGACLRKRRLVQQGRRMTAWALWKSFDSPV
jgi:GT2 family glycosyltransferase